MTVQAQARGDVAARAGSITDYAERSLQEFDAGAFRQDVEEQIRKRPIVSVLLAVGLGFVIGRILRS